MSTSSSKPRARAPCLCLEGNGIPLAKVARLMTPQAPRTSSGQLASGKDLGTGAFYYVKSPVFPVQVRRRGYGSRAGDALHRRSHGRRLTFGEAFAKAQLSAGQSCHRRHGLLQRQRPDKTQRRSRRATSISASASSLRKHSQRPGEIRPYRRARLQGERGRPTSLTSSRATAFSSSSTRPWPGHFFDEKAIRRAAVLARIPTITTIAAAQAAVEESPMQSTKPPSSPCSSSTQRPPAERASAGLRYYA